MLCAEVVFAVCATLRVTFGCCTCTRVRCCYGSTAFTALQVLFAACDLAVAACATCVVLPCLFLHFICTRLACSRCIAAVALPPCCCFWIHRSRCTAVTICCVQEEWSDGNWTATAKRPPVCHMRNSLPARPPLLLSAAPLRLWIDSMHAR